MSRARRLLPLLALLALPACVATKQDVEELRTEMRSSRQAQAAQISEMLTRVSAMLEELRQDNTRSRGDIINRLTSIERQLVQIQELTGQGQQQLNQLRREVARREEEARRAAEAARDTATAPAGGGEDAGDSQATYDAALAALRRGSTTAARQGFEEFLRAAPQHRLAPDAQFYIGETYSGGRDPGRAVSAFERVVELYPTSARAPAALLRIGRIELERGNRTEARARFTQITRSYARSPEAAEATRELNRLGRQ